MLADSSPFQKVSQALEFLNMTSKNVNRFYVGIHRGRFITHEQEEQNVVKMKTKM